VAGILFFLLVTTCGRVDPEITLAPIIITQVEELLRPNAPIRTTSVDSTLVVLQYGVINVHTS
jgi:hypothetical protein